MVFQPDKIPASPATGVEDKHAGIGPGRREFPVLAQSGDPHERPGIAQFCGVYHRPKLLAEFGIRGFKKRFNRSIGPVFLNESGKKFVALPLDSVAPAGPPAPRPG